MPQPTRWFVKASLIYLVLGLVLGIFQATQIWKGGGLFAVYTHLLTFGWLTQLIFGIALWMFPAQSREQPRGPAWLGWTTFATLNLGLLFRAVFEPLQSLSPSAFNGWMLVLAAVLQWLAGVIFLFNIWPRIKGR